MIENMKKVERKNKLSLKNVLVKTMVIMFSIFFLIILVNTILFNRTTQINYSVLTMIISTIIMYFIIYLLYKHNKFEYKFPKTYQVGLVMGAIFVIQIILANLTYADCGWDCGIVVRQAVNLLNGENFDTHYFAVCSNNIGILLISKYVLKFTSLFTTVTLQNAFFSMIIFNIVMIDISAVLTFYLCKKLLGNKSAYFSLLFIVPLILFSPYIIVPYTDTITMLFPIAIMYTYVIIKEEKEPVKKNILALIEGILVVTGFFIKPTAIIMMIAIAIIELLQINKTKIKDSLVLIAMFAIGCIISYTGYSYLKNKNLGSLISDEDYEKYSMSFTHFLKMGMSQTESGNPLPTKNKTLYGSYSENDALTTQGIIRKDEKQKENLRTVKKRLQDFGIKGYIKFLYNKANWILSDGTFFYGEEGTFWTSEHYNNSEIGKFIQELINKDDVKYQTVTVNIMQTLWILIIIGLVFSYNKKQDDNFAILKLSIIGIVIFLLLFEGRARYIVNHLPIFIIIGVCGIKNSLKFFDHKEKLLLKEGDKNEVKN